MLPYIAISNVHCGRVTIIIIFRYNSQQYRTNLDKSTNVKKKPGDNMNIIAKSTMTDKQQEFIHLLVNDRVSKTEAARRAGYAHPKQDAYRLLQIPHIIASLQRARQSVYNGELASLAVQTLKDVMTDPDAPSGAKVSAVRTSLELAGDLVKASDKVIAGKSLSEMTADELGSMIDRWENEKLKDVTPPAISESQ